MAINKRKDSAALFELIDKSTLKVPKHTGSLKIPTWWSSKNNPAPAEPPASAPMPIREPLAKAPIPAEPPIHQPNEHDQPLDHVEELPEHHHHEVQADDQAEPENPHPLFPAAPSPSIRPPAPTAGARFAPPAINGANGVSTHSSHLNGHAARGTVVDEIPEEDLPSDTPPAPTPLPAGTEAYAGLGEGKRVFAPQTMSQSDSYFGGNRLGGLNGAVNWKLRLARAPMWVMVAGASGILIVLLLIIYGLMSLRPTPKPQPPAQAPIANNGSHTSLGGPNTQSGNATPQRPIFPAPTPGNNGNAQLRQNPPPQQAAPTTPGQVYGPGTITRNHDLYYVIIATTPTERIAADNARLLADNGVDVSIETQMGKSNRLLYKLISVKGFSSTSEAQPLRKRIVEIGHLHRDFAKTRKAWDDATVMKWSALLGAAARG